jgi:hypothetical protein
MAALVFCTAVIAAGDLRVTAPQLPPGGEATDHLQ